MIGGNQTIQLQVSTPAKNAIGEAVDYWATVQSIQGWIDLSSGDSKHLTYNAKIQESTHVFVADYVSLDSRIETEICRLVDEDGLVYDVMLIDDPMNMHRQLEIYLKYTGGQWHG